MSGVVVDVLKENGFNSELFVADEVFLGRARTLFEARRPPDVQEFGNLLLTTITDALRHSLSEWLVLFPLLRVDCKAWTLENEGLFLMAPGNREQWKQLAEKYRIDDWDPAIGGTPKTSFKNFLKDRSFTWLGCAVTGTADSAREAAARKMRMLIAVIFSELYRTRKGILQKSMLNAPSYSVQFTTEDSREPFNQLMASIGVLLPPLLSDFAITDDDRTDVTGWYARLRSSSNETQDRVTAAAQFMNYGIVGDGVERFVHFFISLDALFGVRGKVEKTISDGLKKVFSTDTTWEYRASRLFDLRSALVHGASASIAEWEDLQAYRNHTGSDPLRDVTDAAMKSFWEYLS